MLSPWEGGRGEDKSVCLLFFSSPVDQHHRHGTAPSTGQFTTRPFDLSFTAVNVKNRVKSITYLYSLWREIKVEANQTEHTRTEQGTDYEPRSVVNSSFIRFAGLVAMTSEHAPRQKVVAFTYFSDPWSRNQRGFFGKMRIVTEATPLSCNPLVVLLRTWFH